ncbi:MAG TPA: sigma-70 family RNA polymerase sigma factor [Candidatus Cloacimonadota bacterium]|nr:sigma-70 family RNA polymerase sigma factor [Candidatus Cloacimonadota bacterium]HPS39612.1 sigma-70 family RNA polymerase sigma factor [Candidatus Cloacimonadota bacterium]
MVSDTQERGQETGGIDPERAIQDYGRLAYGVAKAFRNKGLPPEDLNQEALLGLVHAARNFQPDRGAQFTTYAVYWIRKHILLALQREGSSSLQAVALEDDKLALLADQEPPPHTTNGLDLPEDMPDAERLILQLSYGNSLTLKEISLKAGISIEKVKQLRAKALRRLKSRL